MPTHRGRYYLHFAAKKQIQTLSSAAKDTQPIKHKNHKEILQNFIDY